MMPNPEDTAFVAKLPRGELAYLDNKKIPLYALAAAVLAVPVIGCKFRKAGVTNEKNKPVNNIPAEEYHYRSMLTQQMDSIMIIDESWHIKYLSANVKDFFGWEINEHIGKPLNLFVCRDDLSSLRNSMSRLLHGASSKFILDCRLLCKDGTPKYSRLAAVDMRRNRDIRGILMSLQDISECKKRTDDIIYHSYHDTLTGLYNRTFFTEECRRLDSERQLPLSVISGDINGLKFVNDGFGHKEGDKLLVEIAKILTANCRKEDILARTGGDEFCILLPQTTQEDAQAICSRIYEDCRSFMQRADKNIIYLGISLGTATKLNQDVTVESVITQAEDSMYKHKLAERKNVRSTIISSVLSEVAAKQDVKDANQGKMLTLSKKIADVLEISEDRKKDLELLLTLHDIGKISIPDQILKKPGNLTESEWAAVKKHPEIGYRIAQSAPELMPIADDILHHHERWDGQGYPQGLKGEDIPLLSRIVSVLEAFDAMTQDKPYRRAVTEAEALREIILNAGTQFDPEIVRILLGFCKLSMVL